MTCGSGQQTRLVKCKGHQGIVDEGLCKQRRPATTQPCELQACPYWFAGDWSDVSKELSLVAVPCLRSIGFNGRSLGLYLQTLNIASPKRYKQLHRKALLSSFDLNVELQ